MFWFFYVLVFIPFLLLVPIKIYGKKNIEKNKNYIIVCNHQSNFDPFILDIYLKKRIRFIAKKELWKGKKRSFFYNSVCGCIPVDRSKGLTLSQTKEIFSILKSNNNLGIFPEGTRNNISTRDSMNVKNGACVFSIKSKTPILPCYILRKQKFFKKNVLIIGKPFEFKEFYDKKIDKDVLNQASQIMTNNILDLKKQYIDMINEKNIIKVLKKHDKTSK